MMAFSFQLNATPCEPTNLRSTQKDARSPINHIYRLIKQKS